ncbi:MFS transporter [Candidatus Puniceispirillum sp.]|uniref:MFS transporter n=1 Tax=Candidatus Puniceispirillum sp. TaxID=2026719 RepID=UPI003F698010
MISSSITPQDINQTRFSISFGFFGQGAFFGMWGVLVPERSASLGLDPLMLALFLLVIGISLCAGIALVTRFEQHMPTTSILRLGGPLLAFSIAVCFLTLSLPVFYIAGMFTGIAAGLLEAGLNTQASQWEQQSDRRGMSFFHAMFSAGMLIGALVITGLFKMNIMLSIGIISGAVIYGIGMMWRTQWMRDPASSASTTDATISLNKAIIAFLGLLIFISTLIEGGVVDWSALHLHQYHNLSLEEAGRPVLMFSVAMTSIRLVGDRLASHFQTHLLLAVPMLAAAVVLSLALYSGQPTIIIIAYGLLGLALGNAFPLIISTAGRLSGNKPLRQISMIIACAYFGLLTGPALLGLIAYMTDLNMTILALAGLALVSGVACLSLPRILKPD